MNLGMFKPSYFNPAASATAKILAPKPTVCDANPDIAELLPLLVRDTLLAKLRPSNCPCPQAFTDASGFVKRCSNQSQGDAKRATRRCAKQRASASSTIRMDPSWTSAEQKNKIATDIAEGFNQGAGTQGTAMFVGP
jgi:hypothetical protein